MIYILLIMLVLSLAISYLLFERDILSPSVMTSISFMLSLLFLIINQGKWNVDIRINTVFYIMLANTMLVIGEIIARLNFYTKRKKIENLIIRKEFFIIPKLFTGALLIISIIFIGLTFLEVTRIGRMIDTGRTILGNYRHATSIGYSIPFYLKIFEKILAAISQLYIFIFIYNVIYYKIKRYIYLTPALLYFVLSAMSSNRSQYIYYFTTVIVMFYFIYQQKNNWSISGNLKFIKYACLSVVTFFILFIFLGNFTGKVKMYESPFDNISIYAGATIPALDLYLEDYQYDPKNFGKETLKGLSNILTKFGIDFEGNDTDPNKTIQVSSTYVVRTNVYTCIKEYLHDFGIFGLIIVRIIMGYFYTYIYLKIKRNSVKNNSKSVLLFSMIYFPLVIQFISEGFLTYIFTVTQLIQIIVVSLLISWFQKIKIKPLTAND